MPRTPHLTDERIAVEWEAGRAMGLAEVLAYAIEEFEGAD
jgi:hypothetical protein